MPFIPPPLLPILDLETLGATDPVAATRALAAGGAAWVQLRGKAISSERLHRIAGRVQAVAARTGLRLVINDRVDVALAVGAAGVHLGQDDLAPADARRLLGPEALIGLSTHSPAEARAGAAAPVDYLGIGPIFPTATKPDAAPPPGLAGLTRIAQALAGARPLVAIGGITLATAPQVLAAGAAGVAVIRDLFEGADLADRVRAYGDRLAP